MSTKPKRYTVSSVRYLSSSVRPGGYSVCATGTLKPLLSAAHAQAVYTMGERPPGFEKVAFASLDQQGLFNFASNALFCVLQICQDYIRFVVQRLLSRDANFHSSKHMRNYTQDGFVNLRFLHERRGCNEPTRLRVCSAAKQKYFVNIKLVM